MPNDVPDADMSDEERNEIFRSLRELKRKHEHTMNADDLAALLIGAAIENGFDRGTRITGTLGRLGMNKRHAGIILKRLTGSVWKRDESGVNSVI